MDAPAPHWFKSSYSAYATGCLEVAPANRSALLLRDSVHPDDTVLGFGPSEWSGFVRLATASSA